MKNLRLISILVFLFYSNRSFSTQTIGNFDVASAQLGCGGWALDPDNPYANLLIHFYANAPAGSHGSVYIGSTVANLSRPDVNSVTGYPGNHGFLWPFPVTLTTMYACSICLWN